MSRSEFVVTQLFKNSVEFVGNKATNHGRCVLYFMEILQKMSNFVKTSVNTTGCFANIRQVMPTSGVCLSPVDRSISILVAMAVAKGVAMSFLCFITSRHGG